MIINDFSMQIIDGMTLINNSFFILSIIMNVMVKFYTPRKMCLKFIRMTTPLSFLRIDGVAEGTVTRFVVLASPEKVTMPLPM